MDVSRRENSVILLEDDYSTDYQGFDPNSPESFIFFNLMQNAYYEQSVLFASKVDEFLRKTDFAVSSYTGIHQDPFWLLWKTAMPAVLLELGFISNPGDLKVLTSAAGRDDIAAKLLAAFTSFKTSYDASLNAQTASAAVESPTPAPAPASAPVVASVKTDEAVKAESDLNVYYGVQIMGLGRLIKNGDPALKGLEIQAVKAPGSNIYKYVTGKFRNREGAANILPVVKKKFPEAFLVKVEGDTVNRLR
jgi:N-acetylmuramoyl-L-alanine amidase